MKLLSRIAGRGRWLIPAVLLAVFGGFWALGSGNDGGTGGWVRVERNDLVLGIDVNGTLRAEESSSLGPPQLRDVWEFKIAQLAPEGEEVVAGTPVLGFDTTELQQRLDRQRAEADSSRKQIEKTEKSVDVSSGQDGLRLAEAQARLRKAQLVVEVPGELARGKDLAAARLDLELAEKEVAYLARRIEASKRSADAQLAALRNQLTRAEARVEEIGRAMSDMTRPAPRDGTVIYIKNWQDEKMKVGDTCWRGQNVLELPDLTSMEAEGWVEESDSGRLAENQRVTLRLDAHPDVEFVGHVASIWKTVQPQTHRDQFKSARMRIALEATDPQRMRPGMRFRGTVEAERLVDVSLIPLEAVFVSEQGPVVYRKTLFGHEAVRVELGRRNKSKVEVLGGLESGDSISLVDLGKKART